MTRMPEEALGEESGEEGEEEEEVSSLGSLECVHGNRTGKREAQFTDYSMTSSVVPRSEGMSGMGYLEFWCEDQIRLSPRESYLNFENSTLIFKTLLLHT